MILCHIAAESRGTGANALSRGNGLTHFQGIGQFSLAIINTDGDSAGTSDVDGGSGKEANTNLRVETDDPVIVDRRGVGDHISGDLSCA